MCLNIKKITNKLKKITIFYKLMSGYNTNRDKVINVDIHDKVRVRARKQD